MKSSFQSLFSSTSRSRFLYGTIVCLVLFLGSPCVKGQGSRPPVQNASPAALLRVDAQLLPGPRESEQRLVIFIRSCNHFFSFTSSPSNSHTFEAAFTVAMDIYDTTGVIRHSTFRSDTLTAETFELTHSQDYNVSRCYSTVLPYGCYILKLEVEQAEGLMYRLRSKVIDPQAWKTQRFSPTPVFCLTKTAQDTVFPTVHHSAIDFSSTDVSLYYHIDHATKRSPWRFRCTKKVNAEDWFASSTKEWSGTCKNFSYASLQPLQDDSYTKLIALHIDTGGIQRSDLLRCDLDAATMSPGSYTLKLFKEGTTDSIVTEFECNWSTLPQSFKNTTTMWHAMRHILSDKEYNEFNSGSEINSRRKILSWWQSKDPSPNTVYNEALVAFFRRVDEARSLYLSPAETDGSRTERGKVYILYGKPTEVLHESPLGSAVREIWSYTNKVRKRITFERDSHDVYHVIKVEEL